MKQKLQKYLFLHQVCITLRINFQIVVKLLEEIKLVDYFMLNLQLKLSYIHIVMKFWFVFFYFFYFIYQIMKKTYN